MSIRNDIHVIIDEVCSIIDVLCPNVDSPDKEIKQEINHPVSIDTTDDNSTDVSTESFAFNKITQVTKNKAQKLAHTLMEENQNYTAAQVIHLVAESLALPLSYNAYMDCIGLVQHKTHKECGGVKDVVPMEIEIKCAALLSLGFSKGYMYVAASVTNSKRIRVTNTKFPERIFREAIAMSPNYLHSAARKFGIDIEKNIQENSCDEKNFKPEFSNMYRMQFDEFVTKEQFMEVCNELTQKYGFAPRHKVARELGLKLKLPISHGTVKTLCKRFDIKLLANKPGRCNRIDLKEVCSLLRLGIPKNYISIILGNDRFDVIKALERCQGYDVTEEAISEVKEKYKDYISIYTDKPADLPDKKQLKCYLYPIDSKEKYIAIFKEIRKRNDTGIMGAIAEALRIVKRPITVSSATSWMKEAGISFHGVKVPKVFAHLAYEEDIHCLISMGFSYEVVGSILGINPGTVSSYSKKPFTITEKDRIKIYKKYEDLINVYAPFYESQCMKLNLPKI